MKWKIVTLILTLILISCVSSIKFKSQKVDSSWKNPKYHQFTPSKIFVIGLCSNETMRLSFEDCFSKQFKERGIESNSCKEQYKQLFINQLISDYALNKFNSKLNEEGYDAIFVMAINGTSKQLDYKKEYYGIYHNWYRFEQYAKHIQDYYLFPSYYSDYNIYNLECSMYKVNNDLNKSLIWAGVIKQIDPNNISTHFNDLSKIIIKELELNKLIKKSA